MNDNSPVLLRLKESDPEYQFFMITLSMYNLIVFPDGYEVAEIRDELLRKYEKFDFKSHMNLLKKFSLEDTQSSIIELSILETLSLLVAVDLIANIFLGEDSETFKSILAARLDIPDSFDIDYLKSAQVLFANFRTRYAHIPKLMELINSIGAYKK